MASGARLDHCGLLGVAPDAGPEEVRRAYKRAALRWHPDKNPQDRATAERMFKQVAEAYRALSGGQAPRPRRDGGAGPQPCAPPARPAEEREGTEAARGAAPAPPEGRRASSGGGLLPGWLWGGAPRQAADDGMEDAYNLFEQVLGKDPFGELDGLFEDPSSARVGRFFEGLSSALRQAGPPRAAPLGGGGATPATSSRTSETVIDGRGLVSHSTAYTVRSSPAPAAAARAPGGAAGGACRVRCLGRFGVAYRRTMDLADRLDGVPYPLRGDVVAVLERRGGWVRCAGGYLPLAIGGEAVFELLTDQPPLLVRCLSLRGVAYRRTMNLQDRIDALPAPKSGDVLAVEERFGEWVRDRNGFLPLTIAGEQVFGLASSNWALPQLPQPPVAPPQTAAETWSPWAACRALLPWPRAPWRWATVLGVGLYVAARSAQAAFRAWWRLTFGMLPGLW